MPHRYAPETQTTRGSRAVNVAADFSSVLQSNRRGLDRNPLDLIARDLVAGAIVKLRRSRAFVRRHYLGVFERAAGFEIGGDPRRAESMAADPNARAKIGGAPRHSSTGCLGRGASCHHDKF